MTSFPQLDAALKQKKISPSAYKNIFAWLSDKKYATSQKDLKELIQSNQWEELDDAFFQILPFGTSGRRGKIGVGSNRINKITIGEIAQGLADFLNKKTHQGSVAIAFDTRLTSKVFANYVATIFVANGFQVYLFKNPRSTPELSFTVRHLNAEAGIVISASHNPPTDNGIKIYFKDGAVMPEDGLKIKELAQKAEKIKTTGFLQAKEKGKIKFIEEETDDVYVYNVIRESLNPRARSAKIVFSPLHGTGATNVLPVIEKAGFRDVFLVEEQLELNGKFPTIKNNIPNPEFEETAELTIKRCEEVEADIGFFTDPDADRLGVVCRDKNGKYVFLTGNQIISLLGFYILSELRGRKRLDKNSFISKTFITTSLLSDLAKEFNIKINDDLLVGFKYIIHTIDENGKFTFGAEDTNGFLKGIYARDKDAAVAALLLAEFCSILKSKNKTLIDQLNELYKKYGLYWETLLEIPFEGAENFPKMGGIMTKLRKNPPKEVAGEKILKIKDWFDKNNLLDSNALTFYLSADKLQSITIRPSGTEPFLKIYYQTNTKLSPKISDEELEKEKTKAKQWSQKALEGIKKYLNTPIQ
ncbi:MAG: phospho-sugar mutase [Candidatus Paceibacterota bacterium]|jgi:phosphoglucomutase/phosphomannomutase